MDNEKTIDIEKINEILNNFAAKKDELQKKLQDIQVQEKIVQEKMNELKSNLIANFGTDDPDELEKIYDESFKALEEWIKRADEILNELNSNGD